MEEKKKVEKDYISNYRIILLVITIIVVICGFQITLIYWAIGAVLITLLSLLKDILNELRIINSKS